MTATISGGCCSMCTVLAILLSINSVKLSRPRPWRATACPPCLQSKGCRLLGSTLTSQIREPLRRLDVRLQRRACAGTTLNTYKSVHSLTEVRSSALVIECLGACVNFSQAPPPFPPVSRIQMTPGCTAFNIVFNSSDSFRAQVSFLLTPLG